MIRNRIFQAVAGLMLLVFGFAAGTAVISGFATEGVAQIQQPSAVVNPQALALSETEQRYIKVYDSVSPSVVAISIASDFGGGSGSGFVIDEQGHIVTNFHVIDGAEEIQVNFLDGTITRAEIIGEDPESDLAVIKVNLPVERLYPAQFGDSDALVVGQNVVAIGSPFGQNWTLTAGIVSAVDRAIAGFSQFRIGGAIQTDTPINPGNSGGPLLNLDGQVVGVNSQIRSETRSNSGIGFAVPGNLTARVANELIATGEVNYSYIGIQGRDVFLQDSEDLSLPNDLRGVLITNIVGDGPASIAGLQSATVIDNTTIDNSTADIITAIDGENLTSFDSLISFLAKETVPGDTVTLTVYRNGELIDIRLTLADRPDF